MTELCRRLFLQGFRDPGKKGAGPDPAVGADGQPLPPAAGNSDANLVAGMRWLQTAYTVRSTGVTTSAGTCFRVATRVAAPGGGGWSGAPGA